MYIAVVALIAAQAAVLFAGSVFGIVHALAKSVHQHHQEHQAHVESQVQAQSVVYFETECKETKETEIRTERIRIDSNICAGAY